ncbi:MAG: ParB/RepB/Spo0J family partition protein [Nitrososphaeria archaeon]
MKTWQKCEQTYVSVGSLFPNPYNPNRMGQCEYEGLKKDCHDKGIEGLPAILVVPKGDRFMIVDGEHRWRAALELGYDRIKAEIVNLSEDEVKVECLKRNYQRGRIDYFKAAELLREEKEKGSTIREIAEKYNLSVYMVDCIIQFARFPEAVKDFIRHTEDKAETVPDRDFKFTFRHLVAISKLPQDKMLQFAQLFRDRHISGPEAERETTLFLIRQQFLNILEEKAKRGLLFPKVAEMLRSLLERNPMVYSEEKIKMLTDVEDEQRQELLAKKIFLENIGERASLYSLSPLRGFKGVRDQRSSIFRCGCGRAYRVRGKVFDELDKWCKPPTKVIEIKGEHVGRRLHINYADMVSFFE